MRDRHRIVEAISRAQPRIIGVDGNLGAGKTQVAEQIAMSLNVTCLHLDSFLLPSRGTFVPSINYEVLRRVVDQIKTPTVIEGVCLLAVLQRISCVPNYLIFVDPDSRFDIAPKSPILVEEVRLYLGEYSPRSKADAITSLERPTMPRSTEVDIAYIRAKTTISVVLAVGGLLQTISGAFLLNAGLNDHGTANFSIMGAQFSATGLGGIVLCTSVLWAFFAYRARPTYSITSESQKSTKADGSSESYVFESRTQMRAGPKQGRKDANPE